MKRNMKNDPWPALFILFRSRQKFSYKRYCIKDTDRQKPHWKYFSLIFKREQNPDAKVLWQFLKNSQHDTS